MGCLIIELFIFYPPDNRIYKILFKIQLKSILSENFHKFGDALAKKLQQT